VRIAAGIVVCTLVSLTFGGMAHAGVDLEPASLEAALGASEGDSSLPAGAPVPGEPDPMEENEPEPEPELELDDFLVPGLSLGEETLLGTGATYTWGHRTRGPCGVPGSLERPPRG